MNATAHDVDADLDSLPARVERLEEADMLHLALLRTLSDRLAALEGRDPPDRDAEMTVKQAAGASGMSETTIRRWAKSGRIKARKLGGRVFVGEMNG